VADPQQHLNAQQIQAYEKRLSEQLSAAIAAMNLRKWAVEQAFTAFISTGPAYPIVDSNLKTTPTITYQDPMRLAAAIYDFIVQPANVKVGAD
jgi:hypothetical protein